MRNESSIPVQARIDIRTLAKIAKYYDDNEMLPSSLSQLVGLSMDFFWNIIQKNLPENPELTIEQADNILVNLKMIQPSLRDRYQGKLFKAKTFENLRIEGIDPKEFIAQSKKEDQEILEVEKKELFNKRSYYKALVKETEKHHLLPESITNDPEFKELLTEHLESERLKTSEKDDYKIIADHSEDFDLDFEIEEGEKVEKMKELEIEEMKKVLEKKGK
jgi:hypothetical protein